MGRVRAKALQFQRMALAVLQKRGNTLNGILMKARANAGAEMGVQKRPQGHEQPQGLHQQQAQTRNEGFCGHSAILGRQMAGAFGAHFRA